MKTHKILIILGISVLSCLMLFSSCVQTGYKTFQQTKGVDHYSFERPAAYKLTMNHANSDPRAVNGVRFVGELSDGSEIVLGVNIGTHATSSDAKAAVDRTLSAEGTELLERSSSTVSGVACEVITFNSEGLPANNIPPEFEKTAFFDSNGRLWDIYVYSEQGQESEVKVVFEHLFSTFKLLP